MFYSLFKPLFSSLANLVQDKGGCGSLSLCFKSGIHNSLKTEDHVPGTFLVHTYIHTHTHTHIYVSGGRIVGLQSMSEEDMTWRSRCQGILEEPKMPECLFFSWMWGLFHDRIYFTEAFSNNFYIYFLDFTFILFFLWHMLSTWFLQIYYYLWCMYGFWFLK